MLKKWNFDSRSFFHLGTYILIRKNKTDKHKARYELYTQWAFDEFTEEFCSYKKLKKRIKEILFGGYENDSFPIFE